jgi:hypothetical protein
MANISDEVQIETRTEHELSNQFQSVMGDQSFNVGTLLVLRHYQVKCGDIDKRKWRESKDEIEEMFLVPLNSFQLPAVPQRVEGVLVTNGHANPYVEPVIDGWLQMQREDHGRFVEFMHLDGLVDWIVEHRLVNELKRALQEQGIDV